jgi:hypothetical protein
MRRIRPALVCSLLGVALAAGSIGCAPVRPWQREALASPAMTESPFGDPYLEAAYRDKVVQSTTGGGLPGGAPGGGCGCTQ